MKVRAAKGAETHLSSQQPPDEIERLPKCFATEGEDRMSDKRKWVGSIFGTTLAVSLAACSASPSPGASSAPHGATTRNALVGKSASQVVALAMAAAAAKGSVHFVSTDTGTGGPGGSTFDVSRNTGKQTVSGATSGSASFVVISGVAYVQADATFLQNSFGFPANAASTYAERWISFQSTDTGYQQVVDGDTLASAMTDSTPSGTLTLRGASTIDGEHVLAVSGGLPANLSGSGATGSLVLYVSSTSPFLPVKVVERGTVSGQSGTTTIVFSNWGEDVVALAPTNATPISALTASAD